MWTATTDILPFANNWHRGARTSGSRSEFSRVRVGPVPSISKLAGVKRDFQHTVAWPIEIQKPEGFLTQALNDRPGPPPGTTSPIPPVLPTAPFSSAVRGARPHLGAYRMQLRCQGRSEPEPGRFQIGRG